MSDPFVTAIVTNAGYINNVADAAGVGTRIAPYTAKIAAQAGVLDAKLTAAANSATDPVPADVSVDGSWFTGTEDTTVLAVGGSPDNPNGVTFTQGDAKRWYEYVVANNVGYHNVRPSLLPESRCLSASGLASIRAFEASSTLVEAPEDFNPLGLTVVP